MCGTLRVQCPKVDRGQKPSHSDSYPGPSLLHVCFILPQNELTRSCVLRQTRLSCYWRRGRITCPSRAFIEPQRTRHCRGKRKTISLSCSSMHRSNSSVIFAAYSEAATLEIRQQPQKALVTSEHKEKGMSSTRYC